MGHGIQICDCKSHYIQSVIVINFSSSKKFYKSSPKINFYKIFDDQKSFPTELGHAKIIFLDKLQS